MPEKITIKKPTVVKWEMNIGNEDARISLQTATPPRMLQAFLQKYLLGITWRKL